MTTSGDLLELYLALPNNSIIATEDGYCLDTQEPADHYICTYNYSSNTTTTSITIPASAVQRTSGVWSTGAISYYIGDPSAGWTLSSTNFSTAYLTVSVVGGSTTRYPSSGVFLPDDTEDDFDCYEVMTTITGATPATSIITSPAGFGEFDVNNVCENSGV